MITRSTPQQNVVKSRSTNVEIGHIENFMIWNHINKKKFRTDLYHGHRYTEKLELKATKYINSGLLDTHLFPFFSHRGSSMENSYILPLPLHTILVS